jgi:hypothetical protein
LVGTPVKDIERDLVLETLCNTQGNRTASARLLGFSVRTLRNKITEYSADGIFVPPHERREQEAPASPQGSDVSRDDRLVAVS